MGTQSKRFSDRQGFLGRENAGQGPLSQMPSANAREGLVPTSRANFSPEFPLPWMRERAEVLHRLFTRVEARRKQGLSLEKALRRRWHGPRFHTAHRVKVRMGMGSLRVLYYYWARSGKTPECLAVRFPSKLPPVPSETVRAFVTACGVAGVTKFSQALRLIDSKGVPYRRVLVALPDQALRIIRKTFAAGRKAEIEARKVVKQSQGQLHRLLAADAARRRKVNRLADSFIGRRGGSGVESTSLEAKAPVQATGAIFKRVPQEVTK